jgi:hypothetical protein
MVVAALGCFSLSADGVGHFKTFVCCKDDDDKDHNKNHTMTSLTARLQTLPTILELGDVSFQ